MQISAGKTENNIPVGNYFDKYNSANFLVKKIMGKFYHAVDELVELSRCQKINEIGCGEGMLSIYWALKGYQVRASDFSQTVIELAQKNAVQAGVDIDWSVKNIYQLSIDDSEELLVCCEVLEHLDEPELALKQLQSITKNKILLSVPREPVWRILNMLRGKYWRDFGNTPGHVQAWSTKKFIQSVSQYFQIEHIRTPLPWSILLCSKK